MVLSCDVRLHVYMSLKCQEPPFDWFIITSSIALPKAPFFKHTMHWGSDLEAVLFD